jgi:arginine exporter protein ArgO
MHVLIGNLAPILAAETSKTPFYIAGGALAAWALVVTLAVGLRRPSFPSTQGAQWAVMAVSAVLVVLAAATAVATG